MPRRATVLRLEIVGEHGLQLDISVPGASVAVETATLHGAPERHRQLGPRRQCHRTEREHLVRHRVAAQRTGVNGEHHLPTGPVTGLQTPRLGLGVVEERQQPTPGQPTVGQALRHGRQVDLVQPHLGDGDPVPIVPPFADVLLDHIATRSNRTTATNPASTLLFPGRRAGQPTPARYGYVSSRTSTARNQRR
jgi:hypothetical protein